MTFPTHVYVDPAINGDSGTGTKLDPYGDLQYGLNQETAGGSGHQFNIKVGTAESLAAALSLTTYGAPTNASPLMFRGYTTDENDGGIGEIDGGGSYGMIAGNPDYVNFVDMELHNSGSNPVVDIDLYCVFINCEIHNSTGIGLSLGNRCHVIRCHIHNIGSHGVYAQGECFVLFNYFKNGTNSFTNGVYCNNFGTKIIGNIFSLGGSSNGINLRRENCIAFHNTMKGGGGTGSGVNHNNSPVGDSIESNICVDFDGVGGHGVDDNANLNHLFVYGANAAYNNDDDYEDLADYIYQYDQESLGSDPIWRNGSDTFAGRFDYYETKNVGNVWGGVTTFSEHNVDKGAVQHGEIAMAVGMVPLLPF